MDGRRREEAHRRRRRLELTPALALGVATLLTTLTAAEPDDKPAYARVEIQQATVGEVAIRRAAAKLIDLPSAKCDGPPFSCTAPVFYGQVYVLYFTEEERKRRGDGAVEPDRRDRGALMIATNFPPGAADHFDDALTGYLKSLAAPAFAEMRAGLRYQAGPLDPEGLTASSEPVWICAMERGAFSYDLQINADGRVSGTRAESGGRAVGPCAAIQRAVQGVLPEIIRTLPDVRADIRREVRVVQGDTLGGASWASRLAPLPDGVTLKKTALEKDRKTGAIRDAHEGVYRGHEGRYGSVSRDVIVTRADLDHAGAPRRAERWTYDTIAARFMMTSRETDPYRPSCPL